MTTLHPSLAAKVSAIISAVGDAESVHVNEIMGERRTARIAAARQLAMAIIRRDTKLSLTEIGELFNRDHGTVIWAVKAVAERVATCDATRAIYERIRN